MALPRCRYCKRLLDGGHEPDCPVALRESDTRPWPWLAIALLALVPCCGGYEQLPPSPRSDDYEQKALVLVVLASWEAHHGPLPRCRGEATLLEWTTAPAAEVSRRCVTGKPLSGCFRYRGDQPEITLADDIVLEDRELLTLRLHELTHWALQCSGIDPTGDPGHTRVEWVGL